MSPISNILNTLRPIFEKYVNAITDSSVTVDTLNKVVFIASTHFNQEGGYVVKLDEIQREFIVLHNTFGKVEEILQKVDLLEETISSQIHSYLSITTCDERVIKQTDLLQENLLTNEFQILEVLHASNQEIVGIEDLPYKIIKIHDSSTSIALVKRKYDGNGYLLIDEDTDTKEFTLNVIHQIFSGLQYLYANQISHADIKEENLLIRKQNNQIIVHIADFEGACLVKKTEDILQIDEQPYSVGYTSEQDLAIISDMKKTFNDGMQNENFLNELQYFVHARDVYSCCYMLCNLFVEGFSELQFQLGYRESSEFLTALNARGLSEQMISLFQKGLDPDYLNRPIATDFLNAPDFKI